MRFLPNNPFKYNSPIPSDYFCNRASANVDVKNRIDFISGSGINIVGMPRSGKTSLLYYIKERPHEFCIRNQKPLIVMLDLQSTRCCTPADITEGLRRGIVRLTGAEPWSQNVKAPYKYEYEVEDGLQALRDNGYHLIVMLDKFEYIVQQEWFEDWGENWRAKAERNLFVLVIASQRCVGDYEIQPLFSSPLSDLFSYTIIGVLEENAWHQLVHDGFARSAPRPQPSLEFIDELAGGLPFYTQMAAALLWQHQNNEQLVREEFSFQATRHFHNLWRNLTVPEREVIRNAANGSVSVPTTGVPLYLNKYGLLRANGSLFSSVFSHFVRNQ